MPTLIEANRALRFNHKLLFSKKNLIYAAVVPHRNQYGRPINDYYIETGVLSRQFEEEIIEKSKAVDTSPKIPVKLEIPLGKGKKMEERKTIEVKLVETPEILSNSYDYPRIPAVGGVSIGNSRYPNLAGSLGAVIKFKNNPKIYLISNWHILWGAEGRKGDDIIQPGSKDRGVKTIIAKATKGLLNTRVDAAIAEVISPDLAKGGTIDFGPLGSLKRGRIDTLVQKSGRSSEFTIGKILSINCSCRIKGPYPNGEHIFVNQIMTTLMSTSGDSGSLLCDRRNNVLGLILAGDKKRRTFANHISNIFPKKNILLGNREHFEFESFLNYQQYKDQNLTPGS